MSDMTPIPSAFEGTLRRAAGRQLGPTTVAVAAAMAISLHSRSCDITRIGYDHSGSAARAFITGTTWRCWVLAAVLVPIAATAYWLLELITDLAGVVFIDLPNGLAPRMGAAVSSPDSAPAAGAGKSGLGAGSPAASRRTGRPEVSVTAARSWSS